MSRRLLISATILIPDSVIQLSVCLALCLVFLNHHLNRTPFSHDVSNKAEAFSLTLLCGVAAINLLKDLELNPESHRAVILSYLDLMEGIFVVLLIIFIIFFEAAFTIALRTRNKAANKIWEIKLPCWAKYHTPPRQNHAEAGPSTSHTEEELELEGVVHDNPVFVGQEHDNLDIDAGSKFENMTKM